MAAIARFSLVVPMGKPNKLPNQYCLKGKLVMGRERVITGPVRMDAMVVQRG